MTLDSPGVFVLDTAYVPDVLGLRTRYPDAAPVKVLNGRAHESVWVLIPDAKQADCGFLISRSSTWLMWTGLLYRGGRVSLTTSVASFGGVRYVPETDLEVMCHECKRRFCGARTGCIVER